MKESFNDINVMTLQALGILFTYVTKGGHYGGQSSYQEKNKRR
jgi:hypothetical protein